MTETELIARVTENESRSKSNTHRLDKLEENIEAVKSLATSVAVLAEKQGAMSTQLGKIAADVETMRLTPARHWSTFTERLLTVLLTAAATYLLSRLGLQ